MSSVKSRKRSVGDGHSDSGSEASEAPSQSGRRQPRKRAAVHDLQETFREEEEEAVPMEEASELGADVKDDAPAAGNEEVVKEAIVRLAERSTKASRILGTSHQLEQHQLIPSSVSIKPVSVPAAGYNSMVGDLPVKSSTSSSATTGSVARRSSTSRKTAAASASPIASNGIGVPDGTRAVLSHLADKVSASPAVAKVPEKRRRSAGLAGLLAAVLLVCILTLGTLLASDRGMLLTGGVLSDLHQRFEDVLDRARLRYMSFRAGDEICDLLHPHETLASEEIPISGEVVEEKEDDRVDDDDAADDDDHTADALVQEIVEEGREELQREDGHQVASLDPSTVSQVRREQEPENFVLNRNVFREVYVSPQYVRIVSKLVLSTELALYCIEFSELVGRELIRVTAVQEGGHELTVSTPIYSENEDSVQYFVHLFKQSPDADGIFDTQLTVDAYFDNVYGPLSISNHVFIRNIFSFQSPYKTLDVMTNLRRVDTLSPLAVLL
jgi:hypothetical protein